MEGPPSQPSALRNDGAPAPPTSVRQLLRQQREIEEKRKFGLAPLAVDVVSQSEISPNVPQSMAQAPWWYGVKGPTLDHQRNQSGSASSSTELLHTTGPSVVATGQATSFVAGACRNCGSRTHKTTECFQKKKKVGTIFSGEVTGADLKVVAPTTALTYSQKRDRHVGDVGVDLLRQVEQQDEAELGASSSKQQRLEDTFSAHTAQHGGVEIKELPKYLQDLDHQDGVFFDHKTGSMRANPNAFSGDTSKLFRGDLERYRSGDYHHYAEAQYRFLTGESKSFVDFELDATLQEKEPSGKAHGDAPSARPAHPQDVLLQSLYGAGTSAERVPTQGASVEKQDALAPTTSFTTATPAQRWLNLCSMAVRQGHPCAFGSYFDPLTFRWGYKCCKSLEVDAPPCVSADHTHGTSN